MAQTSINVRMDEDLKRQFDNFCSEIGMSMTTAFCIFAKAAVRGRKFPFELTLRMILFIVLKIWRDYRKQPQTLMQEKVKCMN